MRIIRAFQIRDKNKLDKTAPKMTKEAAERWRQSYRKSDSRYYIERERRSNGGVVRYRHEKARKKAEAETGAESDVDDGIMREKRKTFRQIKVNIAFHLLSSVDGLCVAARRSRSQLRSFGEASSSFEERRSRCFRCGKDRR